VENCATDDQTKYAIRKSRKQVKDALRNSLIAQVAMVHLKRRTIFGRSTDDHLAQHVETLTNGIAAHVADLGAPLLAAINRLIPEWASIFALSETSGGNATTSQESKKPARENLSLGLCLNLLKLAEMFRPPAAEAAAVYATEPARGSGD
jgi:hypothetical protein